MIVEGDLPAANEKFRKVVTLSIAINVYSDVYQTLGYSHARSTSTILQALNGTEAPDVLTDIGKVHRAFCWEKVLLVHADKHESETTTAPAVSPGVGQPDAASGSSAGPAAQVADVSKATGDALSDLIAKDSSAPDSSSRVVRYLVDHVSWSLTPFFQGERPVACIRIHTNRPDST